jgi:di/tricarboxylate transporter
MDISSIAPVFNELTALFTSPYFMVTVIIVGSIILFVTDKVPIDGVAFLVLVSLLATGTVGEADILKGFSSSATITVAAMFILSAGLERTGFVRLIANKLYTLAGKGRSRLTFVLMSGCGFFSAFINNTATVAVLLPVTINLCKDRKIDPKRVLMPLSFAAQFGGVCTLIGTTTNLLINTVAMEEGITPFSMFEFAKLGGICFVVGTIYMLFAAKFLLRGKGSKSDLTEEYRLNDYLTEMVVKEDSPLIGQTGSDNDINELGELRILEIIRDGKTTWAPQTTEIQQGDHLLIRGPVNRVLEIEGRLKIEGWADKKLSEAHLKSDDVSIMEVIVPAHSNIIGNTLTQLDFYWRYHAAVLGVRRRGAVLRERIADISFEESDNLLLQGHKDDLAKLSSEKNFIFFQDLSVLKLKKRRAIIALMILITVVLAAATGFCSLLTAALCGAAGVVGTRCLSLREAYEAVDMKVIMLLAGLIPLGYAMQNTGTANLIVESLLSITGNSGPFMVLCVFYLITMILTALMSNSATAVLLAPLAIGVAQTLQVDPHPFLIAITFAASTCFTTPVGYQTNAMVYGPGGYKYLDYLIVGLPLNIIFFVISVTVIPIFWHF